MSLSGLNIIVLDLETAHSADELSTGWTDKRALGLSVGCYYDYVDGQVHWFDSHTLADLMMTLNERQPLMVTFNGIGFDFILMRALVHGMAENSEDPLPLGHELCAEFKELAAKSYDILAEIWKADPENKFERGLNSLDAILAANGLGQKIGHGAQAPKDWQAGLIATVLNYCQEDVYLTKALFEHIIAHHGSILRTRGSLQITPPAWLKGGLINE